MKAWAPDGSEAAIENKATGRYRSTFDVHLTQKGTWRIASLSAGVMGSSDLAATPGPLRRGRTTPNLARSFPAGPTNAPPPTSKHPNGLSVTIGEPNQPCPHNPARA